MSKTDKGCLSTIFIKLEECKEKKTLQSHRYFGILGELV